MEDAAVAELARKEKRILITFDLDFGEMYYFAANKTFSAIVLRLNDQRVEAVNGVLRRFLGTYGSALRRKKKNLFIVSDSEVRVVD